MGSSIFFDAIVVGGGPAGAAAAITLTRAGWQSALLERKPRYRSKACGHCLSPRAWPLLQRLGVAREALALACGRTGTLRVHVSSSEPLDVTISDADSDLTGLVVNRSRFDQMLIDRAAHEGVTVLQPASFITVRRDGDRFEVGTRVENQSRSMRCRLLVGADGLRSRVAASAGLSSNARAPANLGFSFDLRGRGATSIQPGVIEMFLANDGYLGMVRTDGDGVHVGGMVRQTAGCRRNPLEFCRAVAGNHARLQAAFDRSCFRESSISIHGAAPMPWRPQRRSAPGVVLVGDAAGYVEPFTGEGMTWALASAMMLGDIAAMAPRKNWTRRESRDYEQRWRREIGRSHRVCRAIGFVLRSPRLVRAAARIARCRPVIAEHVAQLVVSA